MNVPEWFVTQFDVKIDNGGYESDLQDEVIEMPVNLEADALFKRKNLSEYRSNIYAATKYPELRAAAEQFLLEFQTSYMVEADLSRVNAILTNLRN